MRGHRDLIVLLVVVFGIGLANQVATAHQQDEQRRQGQVLEAKLCTTFGRLARLEPPAGNPVANPSRGYEQAEHATLVQLGADLGCAR